MASYSDLANAIAQAEGFGVPGAIPTRNNNPGDLKSGGAIAVYPDSTAGFTALQTQLDIIAQGKSKFYTPGMTLSQFGSIYSGGDPNFASNVADYLGVSPDTPFSSVYGSQGQTQAPGSTQASPTPDNGSEGPGIASMLDPTGISSLFAGGSSNVVTIIIGLILIAAGVFGFNRVREVVVNGSKALAEGAAA